MSHFTCLVIGPDHEAQLQPFHEFECTGTDDQYVQDIDKTAEYREEYAADTENMLRGPDGKLHSFFDEHGSWRHEFSKPAPERFDDRRRVRFVPDGYAEVTVPSPEALSFAQWIKDNHGQTAVPFGQKPDLQDQHKYGYVLLDAAGDVIKVIDRTNPNKQWDWYQVGGRWAGFFKLKAGHSGERGESGLMGSCTSEDAGRADQCLKGAIDFAGMRDDAGAKAGELWDRVQQLTGGQKWDSWEAVRERIKPIEEARKFYADQPAVRALKEGDRDQFGWDLDDRLAGTREAYVQRARNRAGCTFAVLHTGEWIERGDMGWFGVVHDEMDEDRWCRVFADLIDGLPDDTLLTVVDCHI